MLKGRLVMALRLTIYSEARTLATPARPHKKEYSFLGTLATKQVTSYIYHCKNKVVV